MKTIPHDRRSILYMNAIEEAPERAENENISETDLNSDEIANFLLEIEKKPRPPVTLHEKLADLGVQLSHAVLESREQDANELEAAYYDLAKSHPQARIMKEVPQLIREHSVPGYDYRNWKGTKEGLQFGMIAAEIDDNATVGILGDWGTGDEDAQALLQEMKDKHNPDVYIHLGDIYRSCRYHRDVLPNFIDIFDAVYPKDKLGNPTRPPILTIAGNHDYMSNGGYGFFKLLDNVNNHHPKWKQQASFFCIRTKSKKWQFLGADTGINDPSYAHSNQHPGLEPDEYTWHYDKMNNFPNKGKGRTIFMTHHPLMSADHPLQDGAYLNKDLTNHFNGYLTNGSVQDGEIRFWMWGHNHWFIPYASGNSVGLAKLDKGRLIGGSARHDYHSSSEVVNSKKHVIQYDPDGKGNIPLVPNSNNNLPNHTYAIMKLSDADVEVTHYQKPSWDYNDNNKSTTVKNLPNKQHKVLLREYILDTKPMQKYPKK